MSLGGRPNGDKQGPHCCEPMEPIARAASYGKPPWLFKGRQRRRWIKKTRRAGLR